MPARNPQDHCPERYDQSFVGPNGELSRLRVPSDHRWAPRMVLRGDEKQPAFYESEAIPGAPVVPGGFVCGRCFSTITMEGQVTYTGAIPDPEAAAAPRIDLPPGR